jgi:uncharacterized protein involved in tolerance to divalent cations
MPQAADDVCEVIITAHDPDWLVEFTRRLVTDRLCASGHNFAPIRTIYRWHGQVHDTTEGRVALRTRRSLLPQPWTAPSGSTPTRCPASSPSRSSTAAPTTSAGSWSRPNSRPETSCEQLSWREPRSPATPRVEVFWPDGIGMPDPGKVVGDAPPGRPGRAANPQLANRAGHWPMRTPASANQTWRAPGTVLTQLGEVPDD